MNYLDLFHGIGGFALGAYWAGMKFENHYCSDIEPYLVELYKKRFPDNIQLGDIREIDCEKLMADTDKRRKKSSVQTRGNESEKSSRTDWIITGGFPCQDISVAGKGTGIRGSRSGLWFEMWRIIRDLRPRFAIMENVGALTFRGLTDVLGSLAEIGYDAEWQDIRAEDMGAPHRRERIWIVAYPASFSCNSRNENKSRQKEIQEKRSSGDKGGWTVEPTVGRLAHGIPGRVDRLKGLGNSIVPQIAELLFRQIKEQMKWNYEK